jgi:hypothetical protein
MTDKTDKPREELKNSTPSGLTNLPESTAHDLRNAPVPAEQTAPRTLGSASPEPPTPKHPLDHEAWRTSPHSLNNYKTEQVGGPVSAAWHEGT